MIIEKEDDLQMYFQVMREILYVTSMDLKYYFDSLFVGEKPRFKIYETRKERRKKNQENQEWVKKM